MANFYDTDNVEYRPVEGRQGRPNVNSKQTNDTATTITVPVGSVAAVTLAAANPERIAFSASLTGIETSATVHIRYYPAATDDIAQGMDVLTRYHVGNNNHLKNNHTMPQGIYTGEISAIAESGAINIVVTEY